MKLRVARKVHRVVLAQAGEEGGLLELLDGAPTRHRESTLTRAYRRLIRFGRTLLKAQRLASA